MADSKLVGGTLLLSGTAIGAGMLAMPISTGVAGFSYAVCAILLTFTYMLLCLFLLLEANLHSKKVDANIISMADEFLGRSGSIIAWIAFLLLLYSASAAYISAGGSLLLSINFIASVLDHKTTCIIFALIFAAINFSGVKIIDLINRFCMLGLGIAYFALIFIVAPKIEMHNLLGGNPKLMLATIPMLVLSFTSHLILPSLRQYFDNDIKKLKQAMIYGSILPLIVYLIWELMLLGVIPQVGPESLITVAKSDDALATINTILEHKKVIGMASTNSAFSFFAIVTSYLGVILSLADFIADGVKIKRDLKGKILITVLASMPPLAFALFYPKGFTEALGYAGVFVAILYCIMPVLIVWRARYQKGLVTTLYQFPGGKLGLSLMGIIGFGIICLQILGTLNLLPQV